VRMPSVRAISAGSASSAWSSGSFSSVRRIMGARVDQASFILPGVPLKPEIIQP
jgi:hypothetical protein